MVLDFKDKKAVGGRGEKIWESLSGKSELDVLSSE